MIFPLHLVTWPGKAWIGNGKLLLKNKKNRTRSSSQGRNLPISGSSREAKLKLDELIFSPGKRSFFVGNSIVRNKVSSGFVRGNWIWEFLFGERQEHRAGSRTGVVINWFGTNSFPDSKARNPVPAWEGRCVESACEFMKARSIVKFNQ